jgi:uncharacterized membrane protein
MHPSKFLTSEEKDRITAAIADAERNTSGEIRVHLERRCKEDVLDHAAYLFKQLNMHQTQKRNGVLIYLAVDDRTFAILGDAGINAVTPEDFWDSVKERMQEDFREARFGEGLVSGIRMAGEKLKEHFPWESDDINELPDEISYGDQ